MPTNNLNDIVVENARIVFRNFSGVEKKFNPAGRRNFCLILNEAMAQEMTEAGWNVKWLKGREDDADDSDTPYIQVSVNYSNRPPKIVLIKQHGVTTLTEETVGVLDWAEITNLDLIVRPRAWEVSGKTGVKAYLKSMYITLDEDPLELKYSELMTPTNTPGSDEEGFGNESE